MRRLLELPEHEFLQLGFSQNGEWLDVVVVRPHHDRPEDVRDVPISMFLTGVKGRYGSMREARDAARSTIVNAIDYFLPQDLSWHDS